MSFISMGIVIIMFIVLDRLHRFQNEAELKVKLVNCAHGVFAHVAVSL